MGIKKAPFDDGFFIVTDEESGDEHKASLNKCTCDEFQSSGTPCRHMYKVANKKKLFRYAYARSDKLIADFSSGRAAGWKFVVRPCNYLSLDIILSPRMIKGKKTNVLTQGEFYDFAAGSVFYDNPAAYDMPWGEALRHIKASLQIVSSVKPDLIPYVVWESGSLLRKNSIVYTNVTFNVYRPSADFSKEELQNTYSCTQDEFLRLLRDGRCTTDTGELITIVD